MHCKKNGKVGRYKRVIISRKS